MACGLPAIFKREATRAGTFRLKSVREVKFGCCSTSAAYPCTTQHTLQVRCRPMQNTSQDLQCIRRSDHVPSVFEDGTACSLVLSCNLARTEKALHLAKKVWSQKPDGRRWRGAYRTKREEHAPLALSCRSACIGFVLHSIWLAWT